MTCYDEYPVSTVVFNAVVAGSLMVLGVAVAAQFGVAVLVGLVALLLIGLVGILGTVCARCQSYYGHRCGLGLGKIVPVLFEQKQTDQYLRTPMQFAYVVLFLVGLIWPIAGNAILIARGFGVGQLVQLVAIVVLLLALAVPHPKLVCSHCKQGECGACPMGSRMRGRRG
jgi:hypothetical protein